MCRLLGIFAASSASPEWALAGAPCSLLQQSHARHGRFQRDGWGVGWFEEPGLPPRIIKSSGAVYREAKLLTEAATSARGRIVVAHIRRASNPRKLPRGKIQGLENTQPFTWGRYLFAHNGTINFPREFAGLLGPWQKKIRGVNDSEILFWLIIKYIERGADFRSAYVSAIRAMQRAWRRLPAAKRRSAPPFHGLNVVFSDGRVLCAATYFEKPPQEKPPALCHDDWPFWQLCYRATQAGITLASEPLDRVRGSWTPIAANQVLTISNLGGAPESITSAAARTPEVGQPGRRPA